MNEDRVLFQFLCNKTNESRLKMYNVYVMQSSLYLTKIRFNQVKKLKYYLELSFQTSITFKVKNLTLNSFGIFVQGQIVYFDANPDILLIFKRLIAGKYNLQQQIGYGSQADVYKVVSYLNKQEYACKFIKKEILDQENGMEQFYMEISCMSKLNHLGIVKIYEVFEEAFNYYIILEYLEGGNLNEYIKKQKEIDIQSSMSIIKDLLLAVQYMHSQDIIHRDLKPQNIMFNQQQAKIIDFGLATPSSLKKFIYAKCGTPGYVAPEITQLTNNDQIYDNACDIFSIGAILYKMITKQELFKGKSQAEKYALNRECHINLENISSHILKDFLGKLLHKDPKLRPSAQQALQHPIFRNIQDQQSQLIEEIEEDDQLIQPLPKTNQVQMKSNKLINY